MSFRNLIIVTLVALVLRAFIDGPCEPCFLVGGGLAVVIIVKHPRLNRRVVGILILVVSCVGIFFDVRERIREEQTLQAKAKAFAEGQTNITSTNTEMGKQSGTKIEK